MIFFCPYDKHPCWLPRSNFMRRMGRDMLSVIVVSIYLVVYCALLQFEVAFDIAVWMLLLSPIAIGWMVYTILVKGKYKGPPLRDDEYGYQGRNLEKDP